MKIKHFKPASVLRQWLEVNLAGTSELFVGFFKKHSGKGGLRVNESTHAGSDAPKIPMFNRPTEFFNELPILRRVSKITQPRVFSSPLEICKPTACRIEQQHNQNPEQVNHPQVEAIPNPRLSTKE